MVTGRRPAGREGISDKANRCLRSTHLCAIIRPLIIRAGFYFMVAGRKSAGDDPKRGRQRVGRVLTKRQREILGYLLDSMQRKGYPPSVREIGAALGLTSSSTVHSHLAALEKKGYIRRDPSKPRAIEVLKDGASQPSAWSTCRWSAGSRRGRRCWPRRTSRTSSPCPATSFVRTAPSFCASA